MIKQHYYKFLLFDVANVVNFLAVVLIALFINLFATVHPVFAQSSTPIPSIPAMSDVRSWIPTANMNPIIRFIEVDNDPLFTPMDVSLDIVCVILMLIASFLIIKSIREYGKSTIGTTLIYFFNATLLFGAIKVIFILDDDSIGSYANVKDVTEMFAWHTLFYYAMILFYLAGRTFTKLVSTDRGKSSYAKAIGLLCFSVILSVLIIASMPTSPVQNYFTANLQNTWFETFGWFHIVALIMSGGMAIYLYRVKNKFVGYTGVIGNLSISLALLASIHAWELLNESWRVIVVSDDFGEFIERVLWIPVFIFILYSFNKLRKIATVTPQTPVMPSADPAAQVPTVTQPIMPTSPTQAQSPEIPPISSQIQEKTES